MFRIAGQTLRIGASTTRPLRVLVVGAGPAAQVLHLPVLARMQQQGQLELALICDLDGQRAMAARRRFRFVEACADAAAAIERADVHAVYLFGSAQLHHRLGLAALRSGKHLFVEKPIAPGYTQAMSLVQAARASRKIAVGAHNRRFYASLASVRAYAGTTGWRCAEAVFHRAAFGRVPLFGANTWLGANGIHALDVLLFMMGGAPTQLWALAGEISAAVPGTFSALMRWQDGAQGIFLCNNNSGSRREEYVFHGLGETFRVSDAGGTRENEASVSRTPHPWMGDGIEAEHRAFVDAVRGDYDPVHSIAAIAPSLFVAELIEAGFSGAVNIPSDSSGASALTAHAHAGAASIAISPCAELLAALARRLPDARTTSIEDIAGSESPRPEIGAIILGPGATPLSAALLKKLPNLHVICIAGLSLERHQPQALLARGIALLNASAAYADSVAELALGLIILGRRRAFASHEAMRCGAWGVAPQRRFRQLRRILQALRLEPLAARTWRRLQPSVSSATRGTMMPRDLRGTLVGLIGWGANARSLTHRLLESGAIVAVYSAHAATSEIIAAGAAPVSLLEALAADIVSLHRGLTAQTRHFLGAAELEKLRPGALLINVARGALIEPHALLARLQRGDIFACLDTFDEEPLESRHPLRTLPNVFLTAHIAGGSKDMHERAIQEVVSKVACYLRGETSDTLSKSRLTTMT